MPPIRILYVNGGTMDMGGISAYMMNFYRCFDKNKIQIDFIVHGAGGYYDSEIEQMGGRVFHVPTKRENYWANQKAIARIMEQGQYRIIHAHCDGMNGPILKMARKHGIPVRISHSHNTEHLTKNKLKLFLHERARKQIPKYATNAFACSEPAGRWLYEEKMSFTVIHNAIELDKYRFSSTKRQILREKLGLEGKYVIGHIGRFDYQKNHEFLISAFAAYSLEDREARLVLIGDGDLRTDIEEQIHRLHIQDKVLLLGRRMDVADLMNIFDVFAFPSRFEGLGIVAIEAQANGLPCIISDKVPREAIIAANVRQLSLCKEEWVEQMKEHLDGRIDAMNKLIDGGYDIKSEAHKLEEIYLGCYVGSNQARG